MRDVDTQTMLQALRTGERWAQEQFLRQYAPRIFALTWRMLTDERDAEELTQDVTLHALQHIETYDPSRASLVTWLYHITYRRAANRIAQEQRQPQTVSMEASSVSSEAEVNTTLADTSPELLDYMEQAIAMLPPPEQTLITMFYFDEMPIADIAYVTSLSPGNVATRLHRIRRRLYKTIIKLRNK